jgi:REP element-mobilizing transposase RayT
MSFTQILYHIVFCTKERRLVIPNDKSAELYKYIWGNMNNHDCHLYRINGMEEHIHLLTDLHPTVRLDDFVKSIKVSSSKWLKGNKDFPLFNGWADRYAAFTVSFREKEKVIEYIMNQREHHKKVSFFDEYKKFLIDNGIEFNEKYLLK